MKKIVLLVLLAFVTSASAKNTQVLVGAEFGQSKSSWENYTGKEEDNLGARVGVETEESRIYVSYNYAKTEDFIFTGIDFETQTLVLNLEAKTKPYYGILRAFVGGHLGAIYSTLKDGVSPDEDDTDFIYGAQGGILVDVTNNISLEAAYKYSWTNSSDNSINPDNIGTYYGALNIKF